MSISQLQSFSPFFNILKDIDLFSRKSIIQGAKELYNQKEQFEQIRYETIELSSELAEQYIIQFYEAKLKLLELKVKCLEHNLHNKFIDETDVLILKLFKEYSRAFEKIYKLNPETNNKLLQAIKKIKEAREDYLYKKEFHPIAIPFELETFSENKLFRYFIIDATQSIPLSDEKSNIDVIPIKFNFKLFENPPSTSYTSMVADACKWGYEKASSSTSKIASIPTVKKIYSASSSIANKVWKWKGKKAAPTTKKSNQKEKNNPKLSNKELFRTSFEDFIKKATKQSKTVLINAEKLNKQELQFINSLKKSYPNIITTMTKLKDTTVLIGSLQTEAKEAFFVEFI